MILYKIESSFAAKFEDHRVSQNGVFILFEGDCEDLSEMKS